MKKFIVLLMVLAMTATSFAATAAYNADDGPSVPAAWDTTVSTSTLYGWGQGTFSATGNGGNGIAFPAGNAAYQGAILNGGNSRLYHHNYNHATTPIFDLSAPGTFSTWVSPNWNGTNQGGSVKTAGTTEGIVTFGPNEFTGPINLFLFSNGVQAPMQMLLSYDDGTGLQVLENHTYMTEDWTLGSWHHVLLTWNNSSLSVGLDGNVLYSIPHNPALFTSASTPGGYFYGRGLGGANATAAWDGWVDDLVIDNSATVSTAGGVYTMPSNPGEIPEPATIALLGFGVLALLRKRS